MKKDQNRGLYPASILRLMQRYPNVPILQIEQPTDLHNFSKQKKKQNEYPIEGGSIGIVTMSDNRLVLTKRSGPNSGWALPGGRVEIEEEFYSAFYREVVEETGLEVNIDTILVIEDKTFISPSGERLSFWLAVFRAHAESLVLPYQTEDAIKEGLEIGTFYFDSLPQDMLHSDKQKILQYFK